MFFTITTSLSIQHNYLDDIIIFRFVSQAKFLDTSAKSFFRAEENEIRL